MYHDLPIFIINLKQSSERKTYMEHKLSQHNLSFEFIEAVNGKTLSSNDLETND